MSVNTYVFLNKRDLPAPAAWQAAITAHGFPLELGTDFDPLSFLGFLPCRYKEEESGFEYGFEPIDSDWLEEDELAHVERFDSVVILTTHSDLDELECAMSAAAALCTLVGGVCWDEEEFVEAADVVNKTREELQDIEDSREGAEQVTDEWTPPNERPGGMGISFTVEGASGPMDVSYMNSPRYHVLRNRQMEILMAAGEDGPDEAQMAELMELNAQLSRIRDKPEG